MNGIPSYATNCLPLSSIIVTPPAALINERILFSVLELPITKSGRTGIRAIVESNKSKLNAALAASSTCAANAASLISNVFKPSQPSLPTVPAPVPVTASKKRRMYSRVSALAAAAM